MAREGAGHAEDSDYETDEECHVHVGVSGILQEDLSHLTRDQFTFIDIDSERPLVTIGSQAFLGHFEDTVGTSVFFSAAESRAPQDPVFSRQSSTQVRYENSTRKKLVLKRVFLNKKTASGGKAKSTSVQEGSS